MPKAKVKEPVETRPPLHVLWRPNTWEEVVGQSEAVDTLERTLERNHTFLLIGPSGVGKTTLARIAAKSLGASPSALAGGEIDAATFSGVDAMRTIRENAKWKAMDSKVKPYIVDECHRLSPAAWDALLKATEEPPEHVYWFFCTTDPRKVPKTLKTRAVSITLKEVSDRDLRGLLDEVVRAERMDIPDDVFDVVLGSAEGSPRQMLVNLAICEDAKDRRQAKARLEQASESDAVRELCQFVSRIPQGSWPALMTIINKLEGESPEGIRIIITNYLGKCLAGAKNDKGAVGWLDKLECFATPYNQAEGMAPLLLSLGRCLFAPKG